MLEACLCIGKNLLDAVASRLRPEVQQHPSVKRQLLGAFERRQVRPAVPLRQLPLNRAALFLRHLEEQQIRKLRHVLVIRDATVAKHMAKVPKTLDDLLGIHQLMPVLTGF